MAAYTKSKIMQLASYGGPSGCGVDFLKSEATAKKVAKKLLEKLQRDYDSSLKAGCIKVASSKEHPGTWTIKYRCIPLSSRAPGAEATNRRRGKIICDAVKASYSSGDLVDSWG